MNQNIQQSCVQGHSSVTDASLFEAERLQYILERTIEERSALLQRVNSRNSATRDVPVEVLSTIFRFACQPLDSRVLEYDSASPNVYPTYPLLLASVSSTWRDVVNSTPQLWAFMRTKVYDRNVNCIAALLRLHLRKCGAVGVTVDLDFQDQTAIDSGHRMREDEKNEAERYGIYYAENDGIEHYDESLALEPIRKVIFDEYPEMVSGLRLVNAPPAWFKGASESLNYLGFARFTALKRVHLTWKPDPYGSSFGTNRHDQFQIDLKSMPVLQEGYIYMLPEILTLLTPLALASDNITNLTLSELNYANCLSLLHQCRNLRSVSMMRPNYLQMSRRDIPKELLARIIQLPCLETFEWTLERHITNFPSLLSILTLPSIRTIILHDALDENGEIDSGLNKFLGNLPISCSSISFVQNSYHSCPELLSCFGECIKRIPKTIPEIELRSSCLHFASSIHLEKGEGIDVEQLTRITKVSVVKDRRYEANPSNGGCWLSRFRRAEFSCQYVFKSSDFLVAMKKRVAVKGSESKFCFEYEIQYGLVDWEMDDKEELKELVAGGLRLEVLEDGKKVDWL